MNIDKFNHEGYADPTTYEDFTNIQREEVAADKKAAVLFLVYVCSSYAGDVETNVMNAKRYSRFAVEKNAIPITPHLLYPRFMDDGNETERWIAPFDRTLSIPGDVFAVSYSRHHNLPKGEKSARPRFHVFFSIPSITDEEECVAMKRKIADDFITILTHQILQDFFMAMTLMKWSFMKVVKLFWINWKRMIL